MFEWSGLKSVYTSSVRWFSDESIVLQVRWNYCCVHMESSRRTTPREEHGEEPKVWLNEDNKTKHVWPRVAMELLFLFFITYKESNKLYLCLLFPPTTPMLHVAVKTQLSLNFANANLKHMLWYAAHVWLEHLCLKRRRRRQQKGQEGSVHGEFHALERHCCTKTISFSFAFIHINEAAKSYNCLTFDVIVIDFDIQFAGCHLSDSVDQTIESIRRYTTHSLVWLCCFHSTTSVLNAADFQLPSKTFLCIIVDTSASPFLLITSIFPWRRRLAALWYMTDRCNGLIAVS